MDRISKRNLFIFTVVLSLCVGSLGYILITGDRQVEKTDKWVDHTNQVIIEAEKLSSQIEGMVSSQRGYLLTRDPDFQKRYAERKETVSRHIRNLKALSKDNPEQVKRLNQISWKMRDFSNRLEERSEKYKPLLLAKPGFLTDVEAITNIKDSIIRINSDVLKKEYDLLNERIQVVEKKKTQYFSTLLIGGVTVSFLLLFFNGFLFHAQSRRLSAEEALKNTEERFTLAVEGTSDGIFDWDFKTNKIYYSKQFFKMLGFDRGPFIGRVEDAQVLIHPEDKEAALKYLDLYLAGEVPEYSNTFRMQHASGKWVWVNSRGKALFDAQNRPIRMVGAHSDITYMMEYQERLKQQKEASDKANRAKSDFLAHMSHEIRTPLSAISGISEIFQRTTETLDDKQKLLIKTLHGSTLSLKDLVNDILDFSKIESGEIELRDGYFNLSSLLDQVSGIMAIDAAEKGLEFSVDYTPFNDDVFYGDKARFRQILINLIGNAIKFTRKGQIKVTVSSEEKDGVRYLRCGVSDTGIGIDRENHDLIFERFKQADSSVSRRYGGTGLGLTISSNLARIMGGGITLESEVGVGSTFTLLLPLREAPLELADDAVGENIVNQKVSDKLQAAIAAEGRALIVEDYEGNIVVVSHILEEMGCACDVARTGVEGLNLWKDRHYDFVLMDIQMPDMDGFTATAAIRAMEEQRGMPRTPIIGMTAHALVGDKDKCIEAGMDAYLPKPIVEIDLKKEILARLRQKRKAA